MPKTLTILKRLVYAVIYITLTTKFGDIDNMWVYFYSFYSVEEKKPVKRSYQKIQEDEDDEDDDYRSHISPRNSTATATQLVGCQISTSLMAQNTLQSVL